MSIRIGVVILALKTMDRIVERIIPVSLMNTLVVYGSSHHIAWGACCVWNNVKHINFCPAGWWELMTKSCRLRWLLENIEHTDTCGVVNAEKKAMSMVVVWNVPSQPASVTFETILKLHDVALWYPVVWAHVWCWVLPTTFCNRDYDGPSVSLRVILLKWQASMK